MLGLANLIFFYIGLLFTFPMIYNLYMLFSEFSDFLTGKM